MKRKIKNLTEQFTGAKSNYDRILGRVDKTLMTEQSSAPCCQMSVTQCDGGGQFWGDLDSTRC